jgi:hypothetical protein
VVDDAGKLDALTDALDGTSLGRPPADVLLLYLGGNDYNPFPGGVRRAGIDPSAIPPESLPGPVAGFLDGLHPSVTGWEGAHRPPLRSGPAEPARRERMAAPVARSPPAPGLPVRAPGTLKGGSPRSPSRG